MKKYAFKLKPLTALHVGTGDVITPLEYIITKDTSGNEILGKFSPENIVLQLNDSQKQRFKSLVSDKDSIIGLRNFFNEKEIRLIIKKNIEYVSLLDKEFIHQYEKTKNDFNNALEINTIYKDSKYFPVIPGSSIKGAIRTAILNNLAEKNNFIRINSNNNGFELQRSLLSYSDAKNDPFRILGISDVTFNPKNNQIVAPMEICNYTGDTSPKGINIYVEALKGLILDADIAGQGTFLIHDEIVGKTVPFKMGTFIIKRQPFFDVNLLKDMVNEFYQDVFKDEHKKIQGSSVDETIKNQYDQISNYIDEKIIKDKNEVLIRIGRWSHVEAVTIKKYRNLSTKRGYGKSRTFIASNGSYYPMGWCSIRFIDI